MNDTPDPSPSETASPFEKFREPRMFPAHWDLSALPPAPPASDPLSPAEPGPAEAADDVQEPFTWERDPFPRPRTYPANWDLSG